MLTRLIAFSLKNRVFVLVAAAVLLVNPPGSAERREGLESIQRSRRFGPGLDVPAFQITPEAADRILRQVDPQRRDLMSLERLADRGEVRTVDFDDSVQAIVLAEVDRYRQRHELTGQNVGGVLPGQGAVADEWVVIGAHHDHVGVGTHGGIMPSNRGQLHPGADSREHDRGRPDQEHDRGDQREALDADRAHDIGIHGPGQ